LHDEPAEEAVEDLADVGVARRGDVLPEVGVEPAGGEVADLELPEEGQNPVGRDGPVDGDAARVGSADAVAGVVKPVAEVELDGVADKGLGRDEAIRCRIKVQTLRDLLEQRSACSVLGAAGLANSMSVP
jgi:hypothetical protein